MFVGQDDNPNPSGRIQQLVEHGKTSQTTSSGGWHRSLLKGAYATPPVYPPKYQMPYLTSLVAHRSSLTNTETHRVSPTYRPPSPSDSNKSEIADDRLVPQLHDTEAGDKPSSSPSATAMPPRASAKQEVRARSGSEHHFFQTEILDIPSPTAALSTASAAPSHPEQTGTARYSLRKRSSASARQSTAEDRPALAQAYHHHVLPQSTITSPKESGPGFHHHTMPTPASPTRAQHDQSSNAFQPPTWNGRRSSVAESSSPDHRASLGQPARRQSDSSVHAAHHAQRPTLPPLSSIVVSRERVKIVKERGAKLAPMIMPILSPPTEYQPPAPQTVPDDKAPSKGKKPTRHHPPSTPTASNWMLNVPLGVPLGPAQPDLVPPITPQATAGLWRRDETASRPGSETFVFSPPQGPFPPRGY